MLKPPPPTKSFLAFLGDYFISFVLYFLVLFLKNNVSQLFRGRNFSSVLLASVKTRKHIRINWTRIHLDMKINWLSPYHPCVVLPWRPFILNKFISVRVLIVKNRLFSFEPIWLYANVGRKRRQESVERKKKLPAEETIKQS